MQTFVHIVDDGSLTKAAAHIGASLPSVVRTLAALEAALQTRLLNRTTRRIGLTDEGREYYERCKRILSEVDEAEAALSARRVEPRGRLRITAPVMFGRMHVAPIVTSFAATYPAVQVELVLLDRVVDLIEEGIDVGIRIGQLPDSSLIAIAVGEVRRVVCASPAYLKRHGTPTDPAQLTEHRCVAVAAMAPGSVWHFRDERSTKKERDRSVGVNAAFTTNQIEAAIDACVAGVGVSQFLSYQVEAAIESGRLRRILRKFDGLPLPIHVIRPQGRGPSARARALIEAMVGGLRGGGGRSHRSGKA